MSFVKKHGITHYQIHVVANKDPDTFPSDDAIVSILKIMMNRENHPILIHCNKGKVSKVNIEDQTMTNHHTASDRLCSRDISQMYWVASRRLHCRV